MTTETALPAYHSSDTLINARWKSFKLYNAYRILITLLLLIVAIPANSGPEPQSFFFTTTLAYLGFSLIAAALTWLEKPKLEITLPLQIIIDIIFIVLLMYANNAASISLLLIIAIAAASLISEGRLALFYAAVASIGILFEQFYRSLSQANSSDGYTSAAMLSIACFAISWLAHSLAKRLHQSEALVSQRELDLESLSQVNALIAHKIEDGVLVVDQDLIIKHLNIHAEAFLNVGHGSTIEKRLDEVSSTIAKLFLEWSRKDSPVIEAHPSNFTKVNLNSQELRISFLPISESENKGAVIFLEDWSHIQTQSHQVKLAALGRLTANIAHEIRNPLSAIGHANQLMQEDEDVPPHNQRMLQIIGDNVERLDQIIKNVLELNRRDRTNQEIVHLESFFADFYNQFCAVENISSRSFILSNADAETTILFDRRHLNQIVWNLCKNGWRHSNQSNSSLKLEIQLTNNANIVNIVVTNDGEKIPENVSSNLFEPFFTTEETGTGLGLYIGRELAEANGASLQYKPSNDGTKFIMLIKKATI